jgi:hypothetical protein
VTLGRVTYLASRSTVLRYQSPPPTSAAAVGTNGRTISRSQLANGQPTVKEPGIITDAPTLPTRTTTES